MKQDSVDQGPNHAQPSPDYLTVGRVLRPHGVRGALAVEAYSEHLPSLDAGGHVFLGEEKQTYQVRDVRPHRGHFLLFLNEIQNREQADQLRGEDITVALEDVSPLPEDVFYHWQIIGLEVIEESGENLGQVAQIIETGANDVYLVRKEGKPDLLLPAIDSVILEVNLDQRKLRVRLIPGLKDE